MQKHRFLFNLVVFAGCIASAFSNPVTGQSAKELADLYENQQFLKLKEYHENRQIYDSDWKRFVGAIFEDNADSAVMMFASVYRSSQDKALRKYSAERISDYYYARGYYKTSERILKDKKYLDEIVSAQSEPQRSNTSRYGIQVGAFSNHENALTLKNKMLKINKNVTIVNKESNGDSLFLVVIGKYSNREVAEKELQRLRDNNVAGFIIQY